MWCAIWLAGRARGERWHVKRTGVRTWVCLLDVLVEAIGRLVVDCAW